MYNPGYEYLSALQITQVMDILQDTRELPAELLFLNRTVMTPAADNEIMGKWLNRVQIADIISDDARAFTYSAGRMTTESTAVPNIKFGKKLSQESLNQIMTLAATPVANAPGLPNTEIIGNILPTIVDDLRIGLYQRCEALIVAMHLDQVAYNRFGIQVTGTWGTPADLKVNVQTPWTNAGSATPVDNFWTLKRLASIRYGTTFNRATMSTTAFMYMIATTEFINKARVTTNLSVNYTALPQANIDLQKNIAVNIIGMEIEFYDQRYWSVDEAGFMTSAPYMPINKVIVGNTGNDNNPAAYDFANAITTESVLSTFLPNQGGMIGSFNGGRRGPISYTTVSNEMNPPQLTVWGVMRGFPRKFRPQMNAVLTVGQFVDTIPVGEPF